MPLDMQSLVREVLSNALQGASPSSGDGGEKAKNSKGGMSGLKGLAAGAGAAALAPLAIKNAGKLARALGVDSLQDIVKSPGDALGEAASNVGDRLTSSVKDKAMGAMDGAGGPGGMVKDAAKQMLPGGDGGSKGGAQGVGKGRRMPVQQSVDIGLPIETVYNQWTQFEEWPNFMHRVQRVTQDDDCTVSFATKIWGKTKEFTATIDTQRPNERVKWRVSQGITHTGVVTFHELSPSLTRVLLALDVDPGSLVEKFARGARHVKRAARADLHRFKAFIEMAERETGAWRGVIEDGEVVEDHDPSYDEERQYSDINDLIPDDDSDEEQGSDDDEDETRDSAGEDSRDDGQSRESDTEKSQRSQRRQNPRGRSRQQRDTDGGDEKSHSGRRRRQSAGSDTSRAGGRSSRGQSSRGGSTGSSRSREGSTGSSQSRDGSNGSRSSGRSGSSRPSSSQSGARGRGRSQSRKS